jgi:hypothetical protein
MMSPKQKSVSSKGQSGSADGLLRRRASSCSLTGLMAGTAIGLLWVATGSPAEAACVDVGSIRSCDGAISSFSPVTDPITELNVTNLTGDVNGVSGEDVINFVSTSGPITINLDTTQTLSASGADADAIEARSLGGAAISLDLTGNLSSDAAHGIYVDTEGDIDATMNGVIQAQLDAIKVHGQSTGTIDLGVAGSLTSNAGSGIVADTGIDPAQAGAITLVNTATINASVDGINLASNGNGLLDIKSDAAINATSGYGIYGFSNGSITSATTGNIVAGTQGLHLESHGAAGTVLATHGGNITTTSGDGVWAEARGAVSLTVTGNIDAGGTGIHANSAEETATTVVNVSHTGSLVAHDGYGIEAIGLNGGVIVTNNGAITSTNDAINAYAAGGDVTVDQTGTIDASVGGGIIARSTTGTVSVVRTGTITASGNGVDALANGGAASVVQSGNISSGAVGISIDALVGNATLTGTGTVTATNTAILVSSHDNGSTSINRSGDISSSGGIGIDAQSSNGTVSVTNQGAVQASGAGIKGVASNSTLTIAQTGNVTSQNDAAISASAPNGAITVTSVGNLSGKTYGVYANSQNGAVSVTQTGTVNVSAGAGIDAYTANGALSIAASGRIISNADAIHAVKAGSGALGITTSGGIWSVSGKGILANSTDGNVTVVNTGAVQANSDGIIVDATNGNVAITQTGNVTSDTGAAIWSNAPNGTINVTATGNLTAKTYGIYAYTNGSGVTVNQTGAVYVWEGKGIQAYAANGEASVTANGAVTAKTDAITVRNASSSAVTVNATGGVESYDGAGIIAYSPNGAVSVTQSGRLLTKTNGIDASNVSNQAVTVTHTDGSLTSYSGSGILASSVDGNVTVTSTGTVLADLYGINASNTGNGTVSVTQTGNLTAYNRDGILASSATGAVTVGGSGVIVADDAGINASNTSNSNAVAVTWQGAITAANGAGIAASSAQAGVTVNQTGDITAKLAGINASNLSDDRTVKVEQQGNITAASGIVASSARAAVEVNNTGNITASLYGINATNLSDTNGVTVINNGNISSTTRDAIFASSVNANVSVTSSGNLTGSVNGIYLEGWGSLSATVNAGTVTGGATGAAVTFVNGSNSSLVNYGTLVNSAGINGLAIAGDNANTSVDNYGTIRGNVDLADTGPNSFTNRFNALFETGSLVDLGSGNWLTNSGTISPGGSGTVESTSVIGAFENTSSGTLRIDIDGANATSDTLSVSGAAKLNGSLNLNFISLANTSSNYVFLTSGTGITEQAMSLANPVIDGSVTDDGTNATVTVNGINFSPAGEARNSQPLGDYFNRSFAASDSLAPILLSLANLGSIEEYNAALEQLSPEVLLADTDAARVANIGFTNNLMSCRVTEGVSFFGAEGECGWVKVERRRVSRDGTADTVGSDSDSWSFTGGAQMALAPDWRLGFGLGGSTENTDSTYGSSDGSTAYAGAVLKYTPGAALFAASVSGSYGWYDTTRQVSFGSISDTLTGSPEVATINARLRAAYTFQNDDAYLRPILDLDMIYSRQGAETETGGIAALSMQSSDQTVFSVTPSVEVGTQFAVGDDMLIRPYMSGGASFYSDDSVMLAGTFSSDTGGVSPFNVSSSTDRTLWRASVGADVFAGEATTLRLYYDGAFGSTTTSQIFGGKLSVKF